MATKTDGTSPNLAQRLVSIAAEIGPVKKTGKDRFGRQALSIDDVEEALAPLLVEHGVLTLWSAHEMSWVPEQKAWLAGMTVTLVNADDPGDTLAASWYDIGTSPTAATSFGAKAAYRKLFHLLDPDDEASYGRAKQTGAPATQRPSAPPATAQRGPTKEAIVAVSADAAKRAGTSQAEVLIAAKEAKGIATDATFEAMSVSQREAVLDYLQDVISSKAA